MPGTDGLLQIDFNLQRVLKIQRRVYYHVDTILYNVRYTFRPDFKRQTPSGYRVASNTAYKLGTVWR